MKPLMCSTVPREQQPTGETTNLARSRTSSVPRAARVYCNDTKTAVLHAQLFVIRALNGHACGRDNKREGFTFSTGLHHIFGTFHF